MRSVAIAGLLGSTMLAIPLTAAWAADAPAKTTAATDATQTKGETVERRITELHAALKITPEEETQWNGVAQAMRENAAAMDKLVAEKRTSPPQNMSAVDDLKTYQLFAQAHVDGLKNLTAAFSTHALRRDARRAKEGCRRGVQHVRARTLSDAWLADSRANGRVPRP